MAPSPVEPFRFLTANQGKAKALIKFIFNELLKGTCSLL